MGVTIAAYSHLALLPEDPEGETEGTLFRADVPLGLERSASGLILGRWYGRTDDTVEHEILGLPYTAYGRFRTVICEAVLDVLPQDVWREPDRYVEGPLYELINFSDCCGTVGPDAARKLALDFRDHRAVLVGDEVGPRFFGPTADSEREWVRLIDSWITGLELASDDGLVRFT